MRNELKGEGRGQVVRFSVHRARIDLFSSCAVALFINK